MPELISLFIYLAFTIGVFLLIRFLVLWYFRINELTYLIEQQKNLLADNNEQNKRIIELLEKIAADMGKK